METHSNQVRPAVTDYLQQHRLPRLAWVAYFKPRRGSTGLGALVGRPPQELVLKLYRAARWPETLVTHGQGGPAALAMVELLRGRTLKVSIRCTDADESELVFSPCRQERAYPCRLKI